MLGGWVAVNGVRSLHARFAHLWQEIVKFGAVGAAAFVIDAGGYNLLESTVMHHKVLTAKAISFVLAATFSYFANRHWTWKHRSRTGLGREYGLFFGINLIGFGAAEGCLAISHYWWGLTTRLDDNISANIVGTLIGTAIRWWAYRRWVFVDVADAERDEDSIAAAIV
jgi:putative flippase GtrA